VTATPVTNVIADHFAENLQVVTASAGAIADVASRASVALIRAIRDGKKVLCFGNGGSATQASHMAGELIGRFKETRRPYAALALGGDVGAVTCISNDFGYGALYERQIEGLVQPGDVAIGLTTSGTSENVVRGLAMAKAKGAVTIALTGAKGLGGADADYVIAVPSAATAHVQEVHLMVLHAWCVALDATLIAEDQHQTVGR
jgi:D-sedoheptulose 7-phosphate isomerase